MGGRPTPQRPAKRVQEIAPRRGGGKRPKRSAGKSSAVTHTQCTLRQLPADMAWAARSVTSLLRSVTAEVNAMLTVLDAKVDALGTAQQLRRSVIPADRRG